MKTKIKVLVRIAALALVICMMLCSCVFASAGNRGTYTNAAQVAQLVYEGYNEGTKGPVTITKGTLSLIHI